MGGVSRELVVDAGLGKLEVWGQHCRAVEVIEDVHDAAAVPVVCHPPPVVDVASRVLQHLYTAQPSYPCIVLTLVHTVHTIM